MTPRYDVAIIGGGILGVTIAYWISRIARQSVVLIDKENEVAFHTSSRNTGVVHRPFYLNPQKKKLFARAAQKSYFLWSELAAMYRLPWARVGTLEVALNEKQTSTLEQYREWAVRNGMEESEIQILDEGGVQKIEPAVHCSAAFFSKTDTAVSYVEFTRTVFDIARKRGVEFMNGSRVVGVKDRSEGTELTIQSGDDSKQLTFGLVINCAGGDAVDIAHMFGVGEKYTDLHFRGEYWIVDEQFGRAISRNVYSVPKIKEYPFLDPHFIVRADGRREVGPNAVLVSGPNTYEGFSNSAQEFVGKALERPISPKLKLFVDGQFLSLIWHEWRSSISKRAMCERVREFIPSLSVKRLIHKGNAGIRSSLIGGDGFVPEVVLIDGERSLHVLNYNSPGATGAPAFSAYVVRKLVQRGSLSRKNEESSGWDFDDASDL